MMAENKGVRLPDDSFFGASLKDQLGSQRRAREGCHI